MATSILEVSGIGPTTAEVLAENGIGTAEDLAGLTVRKLSTVKSFSQKRAKKVIQAAKALLATAVPSVVEETSVPEPESPKAVKKSKKKNKKDKKDKGKKDKKKDKKSEKKSKGKGKKKDKGKKKSRKS